MLMVLSPSTVGVNARLMPNGLNSTVIAPPSPLVWLTGTGNSPPARNEAFSPDSAISVGWASVLARPRDFQRVELRGDVEAADAERLADDAEQVGQRGDRQVRRHCAADLAAGQVAAASKCLDRAGHAGHEARAGAGDAVEGPVARLAGQAHADVLAGVAADFGEADFQHDLLARSQADQVDDGAAAFLVDEGLGQPVGAVGGAGAVDQSGQHDRLVGDARLDILVRARSAPAVRSSAITSGPTAMSMIESTRPALSYSVRLVVPIFLPRT